MSPGTEQRYTIDPERYGDMVRDALVDFRDRLVEQHGAAVGLALMPVILGGMIGDFYHVMAETDATKLTKIIDGINQGLARTGMPYRLRE